MSPLAISLAAFACIFGGMVFGMVLRANLPDHHVSEESKDTVKLGTGMIATMSALILALMIASAKGNCDTMNGELDRVGARVIMLDRVMAQYGPETREARDLLHQAVASALERIWPDDKIQAGVAAIGSGKVNFEVVQEQLRQLVPRNDSQRWLQSRALQVSSMIAEVRWLLVVQAGQSSIPGPFIVLLVSWLTIIFGSFGLFSPRNSTVVAVLLVCALSASGALFLILEMDTPYEGLIKLSSAPLTRALAHLGQ